MFFLLPEYNYDFVTVHDLQELLVVEFPVSVSVASAHDPGHRFIRQLLTQLGHGVLQLTSWNGKTDFNPLKKNPEFSQGKILQCSMIVLPEMKPLLSVSKTLKVSLFSSSVLL